MLITFSQSKKNVLFVHENITEYKALEKFPAFIRIDGYFGCETILPVVYNVIARFLKKFPKAKVHPDVTSWMNQPFKLLPIPDTFKYFTIPKDFQEIALRFLYTLGSAGILLDPGMGKSKVILDYIALKGFKRSFIICPAALLFVWEDEIAKHRPDLTSYVIKSTDWEVELPNLVDKQVVILNYNKAVILKHRLKELKADFMHLDEFLIKDPKTNRTKSVTEISRGVPFRAGGSGTLINNSPMDMYCPTRYLQPSLVGWNYSSFLDNYAVTVQSKSQNGEPGRKNIVAFRGKEEIRSILESCSIVMTKEKWLKLPAKKFHDIYTPMAPDQRQAYYGLLRNYRFEMEGREVEVDNPLVMMSKLYQISQGFLYFFKEDSKDVCTELLAGEKKVKRKKSDREIVFFKDQPKIEALKKLLTTTLAKKKSIIWFNLDGEYHLIKKALDELGENYLSIRGGDKDLGNKVRQFNKNQEIRRLVCQAKSVNYGITVLGSKLEDLEEEGIEVMPDLDPSVSDQVFYSINFSLEVYLQQQDRTHRLGQENECNYYRLFAISPLESKLRETISDKVQLKDEMLIDVATNLLNSSQDIDSVLAL